MRRKIQLCVRQFVSSRKNLLNARLAHLALVGHGWSRNSIVWFFVMKSLSFSTDRCSIPDFSKNSISSRRLTCSRACASAAMLYRVYGNLKRRRWAFCPCALSCELYVTICNRYLEGIGQEGKYVKRGFAYIVRHDMSVRPKKMWLHQKRCTFSKKDVLLPKKMSNGGPFSHPFSTKKNVSPAN